MSILNKARLAVYRFHEKGMEIFLINSDLQNDPDVWNLPALDETQLKELYDESEIIEVDMDTKDAGKLLAVPGDWHNIPSIRGLIKHDYKVVKSLVKEAVPGIEKGTFVAFKEVVKKVMPEEYKALKEIKEIVVESNSIKNL